MDEAALAAIEITDTDRRNEESTGDSSDDAPIVIYINKILTDAIRKGASDLHLNPMKTLPYSFFV